MAERFKLNLTHPSELQNAQSQRMKDKDYMQTLVVLTINKENALNKLHKATADDSAASM